MIKSKVFYLLIAILCFYGSVKSIEIHSDTSYIVSIKVTYDSSYYGLGICKAHYQDFFIKSINESTVNLVKSKDYEYLENKLKNIGAEHIFDYNTDLIEQNNKINSEIKGSISKIINSDKSDSLAIKIVTNYKHIEFSIHLRKVVVCYYRIENKGIMYYPEVSNNDKTYLSIKDIKYFDTIDMEFVYLFLNYLNCNGFSRGQILLE